MKNYILGMSCACALTAVLPTAVQAQGFINGGFEDGSATGWTETGGYRAGYTNAALSPTLFTLPGGRSAVISTAYVDPNVGSVIGTTVYSGQHSYRVEDTTFGGYASVVSQQVNNYTDANIFFAWKAVLEGAHGTNDAATMLITLTDLTTGIELIHRQYNAASGGSGVDPRFTLSSNNYYYTPLWQIEQLAIDASLSGHNFLLSVLGSDCQPTGHAGYVYLDGFGAVTPPGGVPEPSAWAMLIGGFGLAGAAMRRRRTAVSFA
ncbi:PEPxxWA-CTERM sorting domain-containing protein [Sphingomonas sp. JC676]|uniref:PEPxxWA-CTERM sorting domain-containing protein n=1 Tax=Sphingomonas sp. JC676 TaxID=2768065 RepID=UPI00223B56BD|nr:PEPxxWA-CTERM sorting domain-containing protein [Sphingomonas sp. JC676]